MSENLTTQELIDARTVADDSVDTAVEAYMATSNTGAFPLGNGYVLDLDAAVMANPYARQVVRWPDASEALRRVAVCKAILSARPVKL